MWQEIIIRKGAREIMGYRVKINGHQLFGNNESYIKWNEYLKTQGIEIDEDDCYEGTITDFMGALSVIEEIVMDIENDRQTRIKEFNKVASDLRDKGVTENEIQDMKHNTFGATSLFDLNNIYEKLIKYHKYQKDDIFPTSLFDELMQHTSNGYLFLPVTFYNICASILEEDRHFADKKHFNCYKLKDGEVISVSAC